MHTEFFNETGNRVRPWPSIDKQFAAPLIWTQAEHWAVLRYPLTPELVDLISADNVEQIQGLLKNSPTAIIVAKSWSDPEPSWHDEVKRLKANGQKIMAIKETRQHTGFGLREAVDFVDRLEVDKVCPGKRCQGAHDTDVSNGQEQASYNGQMSCNDCGAAIYYCNWDDHYHHINLEIAKLGCFLIPAETRIA